MSGSVIQPSIKNKKSLSLTLAESGLNTSIRMNLLPSMEVPEKALGCPQLPSAAGQLRHLVHKTVFYIQNRMVMPRCAALRIQ